MESISTDVDEDAVEPRLEVQRVSQGRPLAPRLKQSVMGRVLCFPRVAQDRPREPVRRVEVVVGQTRKGSSTTGRLIDLRRQAV